MLLQLAVRSDPSRFPRARAGLAASPPDLDCVSGCPRFFDGDAALSAMAREPAVTDGTER